MMCNPLNTPSTLKNKIKNPKHNFLGGEMKNICFAQTTKYQIYKGGQFPQNFKQQIYNIRRTENFKS